MSRLEKELKKRNISINYFRKYIASDLLEFFETWTREEKINWILNPKVNCFHLDDSEFLKVIEGIYHKSDWFYSEYLDILKKEMKEEVERDYVSKLEVEFERYRVFGDNRDLDLSVKEIHNLHGERGKSQCVIYKVSPRLQPELQLVRDNIMWVCEYCIVEYVESFKKYRVQNNMPEQNDEDEVINVFTRMAIDDGITSEELEELEKQALLE